jgi:dihydrofolate reductase
MRKMIAALQVSVDGFIEGRNGELDWVETWEDPFGLSSQVDACVLGGGMYPGYEWYWRTILRDPEEVLPFTGRAASPGEIRYAHFADRTPHVVLSTTIESVDWPVARVVRSVEEIRRLTQQPGKDIYVVGGARLVGSLMNEDLIDELRLLVHPVVLGGGKALLKDVEDRRDLELIAVSQATERALLTYRRRATAIWKAR